MDQRVNLFRDGNGYLETFMFFVGLLFLLVIFSFRFPLEGFFS